MDFKEIAAKINAAVEANRAAIIAVGEDIYKTPETGYREHKSMARAVKELESLGLTVTTYEGTTGYSALIDTGKPGPTVAIMGELDSVVCFDHPHCNPETGAVHACGHHIQVASSIGAAYALLKSGVLAELCGKILIVGVPAEEFLEIGWRNEQREKGDISFLGGKCEFIKRGVFDGVSCAMMVHATNAPDTPMTLANSNNGFVGKSVTMHGRAAHAAGSPDQGINALYAAMLGLEGVNAMRETFKDTDTVRVHPIITKGGSIVNSIPEEVKVESLIRANNMDAVFDASNKFDRAFGGAAYAFGTTVSINTQPGYLPYKPAPYFEELAKGIALELNGDGKEIPQEAPSTGSSDIGDLGSLMPVLQPYVGFCEGGLHSKDFRVLSDEVFAYSSKFLAQVAAKLLMDGAAECSKLSESYDPMFKSSKEYVDFAESLYTDKVLP